MAAALKAALDGAVKAVGGAPEGAVGGAPGEASGRPAPADGPFAGVKDQDARSVWHHLTRHSGSAPVIMARGEGLRLWDVDGREYLDATSGGVWCVNLGYGRTEIAEAVHRQLLELPYYVGSAGNVPAARFAARLTARTPGLTRLYYSNSGSEANEKALKMLRLKSFVEGRPGRTAILYRDRDYHGTTYGALSCSGQPERSLGFGPLLDGFHPVPHALCYRCHFGESYPGCDLQCARAVGKAVEALGAENVAGGIFEPITAGGGVIVPVKEYWEIVSDTFKRHSLGLIIDEVVCGLGRTGTMFAYQGYGLAPDLVTMAKGLASAYMPISATAATEAVFGALQSGEGRLGYFRDISTFGGSAAAAAAALANLELIEQGGLLDHVRAMGERLLDGLRESLGHPNVGDVRGLGLLAGVEFVDDKRTRAPLGEDKVIAVAAAMARRGVLAGRTNRSLPGYNTVINFAPAYVVTADDLDVILRAFRESVREVLGPAR